MRTFPTDSNECAHVPVHARNEHVRAAHRVRLFASALTLTICMLQAPALAEPAAPATLRLSDIGHIAHWREIDGGAVLIEGDGGRMFEVRFFHPCLKLAPHAQLGFVQDPTHTLGRYDAVVVDGESCPIESITAAGTNTVEPTRKD
jgi:hypothetical protein